MLYPTDDFRIQRPKLFFRRFFLKKSCRLTEKASATVFKARKEIVNILKGSDSRLLVLVGPCSIHDTKAARDYASLLQSAIAEFSNDLRIVMRVYFEKPRTILGWKGLINDPYLDGSFKINDGLRMARHLLLDLAEMGVPGGHGVSRHDFAAVYRRPRELGSDRRAHHGEPGASPAGLGVSCPVGFKNGTSGDVQVAIEAILSAAHSHTFLATRNTASPPSSSPRAIPIAISFCAADAS